MERLHQVIRTLVSMATDSPRVIMGKTASPRFATVLNWILYILVGNVDIHKSLYVFEIRLELTKDYGVNCEWASKVHMSRVMRKPTYWFPTWSDTNQAVQSQKMARGMKFRF